MNKFMKIVIVMFAMMFTVACSRETVPPASLGKVLSASGYSEDVKLPGKYWLAWWNSMVILDTSTQLIPEPLNIKMADGLDLGFVIRFRTRIHGDDNTINMMFNDIRHDKYQVTLPMVYNVYGRDAVEGAARTVLSKYRTQEVTPNYDKIVADIQAELSARLRNSPLELSNLVLSEFVWPAPITDAINAQAERELAIETERNNQAVELVRRTNAMQLAEADYNIQMERARAIRDQNALMTEGLSPELIQYRQLEVLEKMAENQNAIFVPYEALTNVGLQNRMFQQR